MCINRLCKVTAAFIICIDVNACTIPVIFRKVLKYSFKQSVSKRTGLFAGGRWVYGFEIIRSSNGVSDYFGKYTMKERLKKRKTSIPFVKENINNSGFAWPIILIFSYGSSGVFFSGLIF